MQPANYPLDIYRGDSGHWQFKLWADEARTIPVNLDGVLAKSQIRDKPAGTQVFDLDCRITPPNVIDVKLDWQISHALPAKGNWDLQLTYQSGEVQSPVAGPVTVITDVTDSTYPVVMPVP